MKTIDLLKNLYTNYRSKRLSRIDKVRWLGGMEAFLIELGIIRLGGFPFQYKTKTKRLLFITYSVKENYEEYILRKVEGVLHEKAVQ